jgi:hypothetical protein
LTTKLARVSESSTGSPEDLQGGLFVLHLHCVKESATGIFSRGEGPLARFLGERWRRRTAQGKCKHYGNYKSNQVLAFHLNQERNLVQHDVLLHFGFLDLIHGIRM